MDLDKIEKLKNIYIQYNEINEELEDFLLGVIRTLGGYSSVSNIGIDGDLVTFTADGYGSYQSEWHDYYQFHTDELTNSPYNVGMMLKQEKEDEAKVEKERQAKIALAEKEREFERLKKELGK